MYMLAKRGDDVVGIDNLNDYYDVRLKHGRIAEFCTGERRRFLEMDIADKDSLDALFAAEAFDAVVNLAAQATPVQCDAKIYGSNHCRNLNDGKRTSGGYQPDHWTEGDWCGLEFGKPVEAHSLVIYWETAAFISTYADKGYDVYLRKGGEWRDIAALGQVKVLRSPYSGDVIADTVPVAKAGAFDGVKVVFRKGKSSHTFAPKIYEMELLTDRISN